MISDILSVAERLGARLKRVGPNEYAGPCPKCGGHDRFGVNTSKGVWNCRGCGRGGDAIELARHCLDVSFGEAEEFVTRERENASRRPADARRRPPEPRQEEDNRDVALALWRRRQPIVGSIAGLYLQRTRGYKGPIPATLGFLPAHGKHAPAIIAPYATTSEPEPGSLAIADEVVKAVHLTRLLPDGSDRTGKITIGRGAPGSPIVIAPPNDLLGLAFTEGIEDALSIHAATGLGVWAAGCAGFMPALAEAVPPYIEYVTIFGDADEAGRRGRPSLQPAFASAASRLSSNSLAATMQQRDANQIHRELGLDRLRDVIDATPDEPIDAEPLPKLTIVDAADLSDNPPPRDWLVPGIIPAREITMLSGDGGTGKSLLALQLAFAVATGTGWIGTLPAPGRVLYLSAEDGIDEVHRRLACIARDPDVKLEHGRLEIVPLAGENAVLAAPKDRGLGLSPTKLYDALIAKIKANPLDLLILDTLADLFEGDEIKRTQARQFIGLLRRLALKHKLTVLLLNHPSLSGMASGAGTSGSTAWNNSVRSRIYLTFPAGTNDDEDDPDTRFLTTKKANYGRVGEKRVLRWREGVFVPDDVVSADKMEADLRDDRQFLDLLAEFERQGREVSASPSSIFAPTVFAKHPDGGRISAARYAAAMERLLSANRIHNETSGPPSKPRRRLKRGPPPPNENNGRGDR